MMVDGNSAFIMKLLFIHSSQNVLLWINQQNNEYCEIGIRHEFLCNPIFHV